MHVTFGKTGILVETPHHITFDKFMILNPHSLYDKHYELL